MDKLKSLWAKFKVQISFVAGCLVVATSLGTCSFDPSATSEDASTETTEAAADTTTTETETEATTTAGVTTTETETEAATTADVTTVAE